MIQFAQAFPDEELVAALRGQVGWTHFKALLPLQDDLKRSFYVEMCRLERWSTRTLQQKMNGMLYERRQCSQNRFSCGEDVKSTSTIWVLYLM